VQAIDAAVVCLINQQRVQHGLPPLSEQTRLDASAQQWADWMVSADDYTHGADFGARITAAGYAWQAAGENIATGSPTPAAVVSAWMQSTDHCRNILSPVFRDVGPGVSPYPVAGLASGPATWTVDFALATVQTVPSQDWGPANGCPY
jgi:uncharacterized protein YkwD